MTATPLLLKLHVKKQKKKQKKERKKNSVDNPDAFNHFMDKLPWR